MREMAVSDEMTREKRRMEKEDMLRWPQMNWEKGRTKKKSFVYYVFLF
jgi:hypothetical protein